MSPRRELQFHNWEEARSDLDALSAGYQQHGQWSLEQTARHLNDWMRFPMDGFPKQPWHMNAIMSLVRMTLGKPMLKRILSEGKMGDRMPTAPQTVYQPGDAESERQAVDELRQTIERFRQYSGQLHASPLFGALDKQDTERLQLIHFAHHLSWLTPQST